MSENQTITTGSGKQHTTVAVTEEKLFVAPQWQLILWKFLRHKMAVTALIVLGLFYLGAIFAEFFAPYDPRQHNTKTMYATPSRLHFVDNEGKFSLRPFVYGLNITVDRITTRTTYEIDTSKQYYIHFFVKGDPYKMWGVFEGDRHLFGAKDGHFYLLGADAMGRDLFSRIIHGSRISLSIGLVGIAVSFIVGIIIGGISGYFGGTPDVIIQRIIEFIRSLPTLPLWMALSVALPPDWSVVKMYFGIVVILSLVGWTGLARVVRGKFMSLREEDFIMAAKLNGANEARIIFRHMLPSFYSYIIASLTLSVPGMILAETSLSFLGLGMQPPAISWGVLLQNAQHIRVLARTPFLLIPGLFVVVAILAFNFVGDGLRDAADPYAKV